MTETLDEIRRGMKKPRPFNCRKCGTRFAPAAGQWIFYDLCDGCFDKYNAEKMRRRFAGEGMYKCSEFVKGR